MTARDDKVQRHVRQEERENRLAHRRHVTTIDFNRANRLCRKNDGKMPRVDARPVFAILCRTRQCA